MGGFGSGRYGGRPVAEQCKRLELPWLLKQGMAREGQRQIGTVHWSYGGEPSGSIGYDCDMRDPDNARLILNYSLGSGDNRESVQQDIRLVWTKPHYGGRRWWMVCPYRGVRAAKLYLPNRGDRFASRKAWRIMFRSQVSGPMDRPFDRLNALQRRLGCTEGYEQWIFRPKGMWHRTFERHMQRFEALDHDCGLIMTGLIARMPGLRA